MGWCIRHNHPHSQRSAMPFVHIQITRGASKEQRAELVREVTDSLVRVLGKQPAHTHVVIQQVEPDHWGYAGLLADQLQQAEQ